MLRRQHALITTAQWLSCGRDHHALGREVAAGRLLKVRHGLYRDPAHPVDQHQRILAAILVHPGQAAASDGSAAWLHKVDGFRPGNACIAADDTVDHRNDLARIQQIAGLDPRDIVKVNGIPCLSPELTLLTLARRLKFDDLELALVDLAGRNKVTTGRILDVLQRYARSGRSGVVVLRAVAERWDARRLPGSKPELRLGRILEREHGYSVEYQREIPVGRGETKFADLAIAGLPILVEFQSEKHHSPRKAMRRDATRTLKLIAAGYHVLPASQDDIDNRAVHLVAAIQRIVRGAAA